MPNITPAPEAIQALLADSPNEPVVMLNLLKFKAKADGDAGTGADAYGRYGEAVIKMVEALGGRLLWSGRVAQVLIGDEADNWDAVAIMQYPNAKAFLEMATSAEYQKIHHDREAGLESTVLIACRSAASFTK